MKNNDRIITPPIAIHQQLAAAAAADANGVVTAAYNLNAIKASSFKNGLKPVLRLRWTCRCMKERYQMFNNIAR